jgi:hypothetical protein
VLWWRKRRARKDCRFFERGLIPAVSTCYQIDGWMDNASVLLNDRRMVRKGGLPSSSSRDDHGFIANHMEFISKAMRTEDLEWRSMDQTTAHRNVGYSSGGTVKLFLAPISVRSASLRYLLYLV